MLIARKLNATGRPSNISKVEPPKRSQDAICQDIAASLP
jgi:hypothetical protein